MDFQKIGESLPVVHFQLPDVSFQRCIPTFFRTNINILLLICAARSSHPIQHSWHCLECQQQRNQKKKKQTFFNKKTSQASTVSTSLCSDSTKCTVALEPKEIAFQLSTPQARFDGKSTKSPRESPKTTFKLKDCMIIQHPHQPQQQYHISNSYLITFTPHLRHLFERWTVEYHSTDEAARLTIFPFHSRIRNFPKLEGTTSQRFKEPKLQKITSSCTFVLTVLTPFTPATDFGLLSFQTGCCLSLFLKAGLQTPSLIRHLKKNCLYSSEVSHNNLSISTPICRILQGPRAR